ncbi:MAG: glycosyltransferase family 2 protein [Planctomycetes bacterium]|nr:glycosyltransferase family 2 protein [Planctomycetota bacterium]
MLSIVVPAYNEEKTIETIIRKVAAANICGIDREIVVVNDCSKDDTAGVLARLAQEPELFLKVVHHETNGGKGRALRTGFENASGDIIVIQDADLEYTPDDFPKLLKPILEGVADVVYGSRFLGGTHRVLYFSHYIANKLLTFCTNVVTNYNLTDMETCYKCFKREVLDGMILTENSFGFEPEFTIKTIRKRLRVYETSIDYFGRTYEEGKKIRLKDAFVAVWCIIKYGVFRR